MIIDVIDETKKNHRVKLRKVDNDYFVSILNEGTEETKVDFCDCGDYYSLVIKNKPYIVNFSEDGDWVLANSLVKVKVEDEETRIRKALKESYSSKSNVVISKIPGRILDVKVKEKDSVKKGEVLFILEAMKMENRIYAEKDGIVKKILKQSGDTVMTGNELLIFE